MKSCRNCEIATHDGYFHVRLICGLNKRVIVPFSANLDENKQADAHAQRMAKYCSAYKPQGESKPEDRPSPTFVSARESAIDEQAAEYGDMDDWNN